MNLRNRFALVIALGLSLAAGALAACKQSAGDHCQVDDDCGDGLTCTPATQTCNDSSSAEKIDASVPDALPVDAAIDAARPDAPPDAVPDAPDAPPDAMIDAMVDAMIDAV